VDCLQVLTTPMAMKRHSDKHQRHCQKAGRERSKRKQYTKGEKRRSTKGISPHKALATSKVIKS
jgi:hypothetical protein